MASAEPGLVLDSSTHSAVIYFENNLRPEFGSHSPIGASDGAQRRKWKTRFATLDSESQ